MSFSKIPTQMKHDNLLLINLSSHLGEDKYQLFVYKCLWCKKIGSGHLKWKQLWINEMILLPSIFTTWPPIKVLVDSSCSYWISLNLPYGWSPFQLHHKIEKTKKPLLDKNIPCLQLSSLVFTMVCWMEICLSCLHH